MAAKRISDSEGSGALERWRESPADQATAVRYTLQVLKDRAPGHSVEVRVPPFGAVQIIEGPTHTRGTPPAVVETDPETWLAVAMGETSFADARSAGLIRASGERSDLSAWLPIHSLR